MSREITFKNGYTFNRVINGCWQLSSEHVTSNLKTLQFELSEEDMTQIKDFIDSYPKLEGDCHDLERTSPRYQGIILTDLNKE